MVVTATVDIKHLIDRGAIEINPTFIPKTKEELTKYFNDRADQSDWKHIYVPFNTISNTFSLTDYIFTTSVELQDVFEYTKISDLKVIRLHFLSDATSSMFMLDLEYNHMEVDGVTFYNLINVTVYDERENVEELVSIFDINEYIRSKMYNIEFNPENGWVNIKLARDTNS